MWNTPERYGVISRTLHWTIAVLFFAQFLLGLSMEQWREIIPSLEQSLLNLHTNLGFLLASLVILRIISSKIQLQPSPPSHMSPRAIQLAKWVKTSLDLLIILSTLSGYVALASQGKVVHFFGIEMPQLMGQSKWLHELGEEAHELLTFMLLGLVFFHAAAALKHHLIDRDEILKRMLGR